MTMKFRMSKLYSSVVLMSCLSITYLGYISHTVNKVLFLCRIFIILYLSLLFILKRKRPSILLITMTVFIGFIVSKTYLVGGDWINAVQQLSIPYVLSFYMDYVRDEDEAFSVLRTFHLILALLIIIDIFTMLKYPEGMYATIYTDNWFLGYKTERLVYYLPFMIISAYLDLLNGTRIKARTFLYGLIMIFIFYREAATTAMWSLVLLLIFYLLINYTYKIKLVLKFFKETFNYKFIVVIYALITVGVFSIGNSGIMQYIVINILHKDITLDTRSQIWQSCYMALQGHSWSGLGFLSFIDYQTLTNNPFATSAHNMILQLVMASGLIGLVLYSMFVVISARKSNLSIINMPVVVGILILLIIGVTSSEMIFSTFGFFFYSLILVKSNKKVE